MELNREQAIDILDKFDFFQGQRAGRELWNEKPLDVQEEDIANFSKDVALLKDYINELTEENERLSKKCDIRLRDLNSTQDLLYKAEEENKRLRADTVREFAERLKANKVRRDGLLFNVVDLATIDRVEKEMLEELNGTVAE